MGFDVILHEEYIAEVSYELRKHPEWRLGQTYFNVLAAVRPDLAAEVNGSLIDPFYRDARLPDFNEFVLENW